ncbi:MAG: hypothetical protein J1G38_07660 [Clostridiales bacterium]|nr:hypothetical protein [Clostridiales bacterium]
MVNNLNDKKNNAIKIAAVVAAFVFVLAALVTGMALGLNKKKRVETKSSVAQYLLVDSATELNHTASALRLCKGEETAKELCDNGLVYAVRAETALECEGGDWTENRAKEAFLNDAMALLRTKEPMKAVEKADTLYKYSNMFYKHVAHGEAFEYNGELGESGAAKRSAAKSEKADDKEIEKAAARVKEILGADNVGHLGGYDGKLQFEVENDGKHGYAVTEGDKIVEFSFSRGQRSGNADEGKAREIAVRFVKDCGHGELSVCSSEVENGYVIVKLCKNIDGALACDECASVVVSGDEVVAFSAGKCNCDHDVPTPKVPENEAKKSAPHGAMGDGVLVARKVDGRERVCYQYRYELDDGVHYVYVCAENGKQMQVK